MMEFHVLGQCKSLLSKKSTLGHDIAVLKGLSKEELKTALTNIEKMMLECKDAQLSYSAAILLDAAPSMNINNVVCERSLPNRHSTILSFVFETSLGSDKDPYRHLLLKCWPLRCWTRKFVEVTGSYFEQDPALEAFFNHIVLCSLLGNYEHNRVRPPAKVRRKLYDMLDYRHRKTYSSPEAVRFRERLLVDTKRVYLHAVQEYICTSISSDPALVRQVQHLMAFKEFQDVVIEINDQIRSIVAHDSGNEDQMFQDLSKAVERVRGDILGVSYEKPVPPFIEFLKDLKSYAKPSARLWFDRYFKDSGLELVELSRAGYTKPSTEIAKGIRNAFKDNKKQQQQQQQQSESKKRQQDQKEDEKEDEPEADEFNSDRMLLEDPSHYMLLDAQIAEFFAERRQQQQLQKQQEADKEAAKKQIRVTMMQITVEHSRQLEFLISHYDPGTIPSDTILRAVIRCFPAFGCTAMAATEITRHLNDYILYKKAKESWKELMAQYNHDHPYAYCILQATRRFIAAHRQIQSFPLPRNVTSAQLRSIHTKHGTNDPAIVPEECMFFYACSCCRGAKSLIQAYKNNQKQNYTEGRREVLTDLRDNKVYCKKADVFAHKKCSDTPLIQILSLGKMLIFKKRAVVFCCQPGCGARPMYVDPEHTTFNEHGVACSTCTLQILKKQREEYQQQYKPVLAPEGGCFLCGKTASLQKEFHLMAKDTYICHRHKKLADSVLPYIMERTPLAIQRTAFTEKVSALQIQGRILQYRKQMRSAYADMNAKRNNMILKQLKRARVAVRGGHS